MTTADAPTAARPLVGWYAHHSGAGHVARASLVTAAMEATVVTLSSAPRPAGWAPDRWVTLPDDAGDGGADHTAGGVLHWAPTGHDGYRARMSALAQWVGLHRPALVVVDVSVEVALLVRLLAVPVVVTLMAGDRTDRAHRAAYDAASALVAVWPAEAGEQPVTGYDAAWRGKTTYAGALSRFDHLVPSPPPGGHHVTVLWGAGRTDETRLRLAAAATATPGWTWTSCEGLEGPALWARLQSADVVVTHAGQNALAEVAAAARPVVVLPQRRPHDEQDHLARTLGDLGLADPLPAWPSPTAWAALLESRRAQGPPDWGRWNDRQGVRRLADHLDALATRWSS